MTESYVTLLCDYFHDFILSVNCHNHEKRFGPPFRNVSFVLALFNDMAKKNNRKRRRVILLPTRRRSTLVPKT